MDKLVVWLLVARLPVAAARAGDCTPAECKYQQHPLFCEVASATGSSTPCVRTDSALSLAEKCEEPGGGECRTSGYIPGSFELPSRTCPTSCIFSPAGYPGTASRQCTECIELAADGHDGVQFDELLAAGECFPADAVWGTRCSAADRDAYSDSNPSTRPSAACWMCLTKAALDGAVDRLVPCTNRMTQGNSERSRLSQSAEQGMNRDSYCQDRVRQDALSEGMEFEHRCKDSGCCHWDLEDRPPQCRATNSVGADECPLRSAIDLNTRASSATSTAVRTLALIVTVLVATQA